MSAGSLLTGWLKAAVRDAIWRYRARGVPAPALPRQARSLLFICKGNICRSPFAEGLARRIAPADAPWRVGSAGITPSKDRVSPSHAVAAAAAFGVDLSPHRAALLDAHLAQSFDLLIVMDHEQYVALRERWPHWKGRVVLLSLFDAPDGTSAQDRLNIADPHGKDRAHFDVCYARIDRALRGLFGMLVGRGARPD